MAYLGMEHLWSRAGANSGNGRQMHGTHRPHDYLRLAANTCPRLPKVLHGTKGVDGSSPSGGFPILQGFLSRTFHSWRSARSKGTLRERQSIGAAAVNFEPRLR
jgi:hypothetical protein